MPKLTSRPRLLAVALTLLTASPLAAQSGTSATTGLRQWYRVAGQPGRPQNVDGFACPTTSGPIDGDCGVPGLHAEARASSPGGGVLKAEARLTATNAPMALPSTAPAGVDERGYTLDASASLFDVVSFGGLAPATLRFTYYVDGELRTTLPPNPANWVNAGMDMTLWSSQTGPALSGAMQRDVRNIFSATVSRSLDVATFGFFDVALVGASALRFNINLAAYIGMGGTPGTLLNGSGTSDFFHTARIGVQALDADGNDVTAAANLTFSSGTLYPVTPSSTVPEPGTWALLGTGLIAVGSVAARRNRTAV